ncbi:hypothetical protein FE391_18725 [Nonomuraea sp. KC401]|uniref:transposase n=1 Tax=Nonomuraea sp. KC401 TaxID=1848324 RepID=UPI0010FD187A|nr:hypothetical protein FE391_18725 [Nonomuraea sp. KC401]
MLAAWGITTAGKPVFVGLAAAGSESTDAWHDFLIDSAGRGLRPPRLIVSDGAPGLISAAAVKCLLTDRQSLTTYLRFPIEHHKRVRHSSFIERTFGETRAASRSSAASPAKRVTSHWCGPCSIAPPAAGAASP